MRTQVEIDPQLLADAIRVSGARSTREVVELGLRALLQLGRQRQIRRLRGKIDWQGDLGVMRRSDQVAPNA